MFIDNKYTATYYRIVNQGQNRTLLKDIYVERHHIIPRCLGGADSKENIVKLTAKEHFICHHLLTKMTNVNKIHYGFIMMLMCNPHQQRNFIISARNYEYAKKLNSKLASEKFKGKQKHNVGKKNYHDEITLKQYTLYEDDPKTEYLKIGKSPLYKIKGMNASRIYYHNQETNEVRSFAIGDEIPRDFIKGNPNANTGYTAIGKKIFHHPDTGHLIKTKECPAGYIEGSPLVFINNGMQNSMINVITETIKDGWVLGKIRIHKKPHNGHTVMTPFGSFSSISGFCASFNTSRSIFDNLDTVLTIGKSTKMDFLITELKKINYDFSKTKSENGFGLSTDKNKE